MSMLRLNDMRPREETDDLRIERASHFLDCLDGKFNSSFVVTDDDKRTCAARVASLLESIKSTSPYVVAWKARSAERLEAAAKSLGMV